MEGKEEEEREKREEGEAKKGAKEEAGEKGKRGRGKWVFGRGVYGSKDVPIRLLDGLIAALLLAIVVMIAYFAINGGFTVTFDSQGGSQVASQKLKYGDHAEEPEAPVRPGYEFTGWYRKEGVLAWYFPADTVEGDLTLYAHWTPAQVTVKFDLAGGNLAGSQEAAPIQVTYEGTYGELPRPQREGYRFAGWQYSGQMIEKDTTVSVNGEHVLTALWE